MMLILTVDFLHRYPQGVIVNLGCGLDTRFARLDAAAAHTGSGPRVVEVDLPPMIALKRTLAEPHPRHHLIAASVLDSHWMDEVDRYNDRRFLFLAEGLFMYFAPEEVKALVLALTTRYPGSELVCEVFHRFWTRPPLDAWVTGKLLRQLAMGPDVRFRFGISHSRELESWHPDLHYLGDWSFLDETDARLGLYRLFARVDWVRRIQWNVHYRFG
jgi:O-methyltransferase involved in polyketide biosynthesis